MAKVYHGASDFVLFPRDQSYLDTFDPRLGDDFSGMQYIPNTASDMHRHREYSGQANSSYESYPPISAYSASNYFAAPNMPFEAHKGIVGQSLSRHPSSGSPSPSVSQTFDHPPSTLSSASGASAQSTASSADGSPYANATHSLPYQEKWPEPLHGLGIAPEIANGEGFNNDPFPPTNFDNDLMLEGSKFANYVGEYHKNFSPSFPSSRSMGPSLSSSSPSQNCVPAFSSPPLALDTTSGNRDVTIDSILEEANNRIPYPTHLVSPASAPSTTVSPTSLTEIHRNVSPSEQKRSFRSPKTPASAVSRCPSRDRDCSPHGSGEHVSQQPLNAPLDHTRAQSSPQTSPKRFSSFSHSTPPADGQAHYEKFQNPFFGQSSGRFVAPLESSCWFSLLLPLQSFFLY